MTYRKLFFTHHFVHVGTYFVFKMKQDTTHTQKRRCLLLSILLPIHFQQTAYDGGGGEKKFIFYHQKEKHLWGKKKGKKKKKKQKKFFLI